MSKERQIDIGMTLDQKILDYLDRQNEFKRPKDIAEDIDEPVEDVVTRCMELYWDPKNGMQRRVIDVAVIPNVIAYYRSDED